MSLKNFLDQKGTWKIIYLAGFTSIFFAFTSSIADGPVEAGALSLVAMAGGGLIGFGIYKLVESQNHLVKTAGLISGVVVLTFLLSKVETYYRSSNFKTCEICGFKALNKETHKCDVCYSKAWQKSWLDEGYSSKDEYIREEQLFWFSTYDRNEKVNFYLPQGEKNDERFLKDDDWKPLVSEKEVLEYSEKNFPIELHPNDSIDQH